MSAKRLAARFPRPTVPREHASRGVARWLIFRLRSQVPIFSWRELHLGLPLGSVSKPSPAGRQDSTGQVWVPCSVAWWGRDRRYNVKWPRLLRGKDVFQIALEKVAHRIYASVDRGTERLGAAVVVGGCVGGRDFIETALQIESELGRVEELKLAWLRETENKAVRLSELFSLVVLSRWLGAMDEGTPHTPDETATARRAWASVIIEAFGDTPTDRLTWFLNYDRQLAHETKLGAQEDGNPPCISHLMLWDTCLGVVTEEPARVPAKGFPYTSLGDYVGRGKASSSLDPAGQSAAWQIARSAFQVSVNCLRDLEQTA